MSQGGGGTWKKLSMKQCSASDRGEHDQSWEQVDIGKKGLE